MDYIPEPVFDEFLTELDMYTQHLQYVFERLSKIQAQIQEEHDLIAEGTDYETTDDGDVWYQAEKKVLGKDTMFSPPFQKIGAISGYCVIVYHLFERFLEEIGRFKGAITTERFDLPDFFKKGMPALKGHPSYAKIEELWYVVNFVKHGKGWSEQKLRAMRLDYFRLRSGPPWPHETLKPLSGYDLEIELEDFGVYVQSIKDMTAEIQKTLG